MPELPEVETMRRGIGFLVGRRIARAEFPRGSVRPILVEPRPATVIRKIVGATIERVDRRGKRILIGIATAAGGPRCWLVVEPRMTGRFVTTAPPTPGHVRLVLGLAARPGAAAATVMFWDLRGLGTIRLVDDCGLERLCGPEKLGPDGLTVTAADLVACLGGSRRAVKVALLDQRAVAGIGNIYAAEILFRAGIDPRSPCRRLGAAAWDRIAAETRRVLAAAVRCEGSSIGDETYKTADDRPGRFQRQHRVYGRTGEACTGCGGAVQRIVQAQRSTFFCPHCQRHPGCGRPRRPQLPATRRMA
ncbi:MAG: bifunctional DNA-formamidopyrimidine glycosylase/DNA-(apurinic or apyrimidinic site) lyase [Planctomycetia bacterium]|jgi:formamidopyrimidine-DNA glycosylase